MPRRSCAPGRLRPGDRVTVRVLLFASWADALGARSVDLDLAGDATAADVLVALTARAGGAALPRPALAVNRAIVSPGTRIASGDEIALIPPVAGG